MPRELRRRASRPNYAALFQYEDEDGAGPSTARRVIDDEEGSGSDFAPDEARDQGAGSAEEDDEDEDDELEEDADADASMGEPSDAEDSVIATQPVYRAPKKVGRKNVSLAPAISARQQPIVIPSTHHRHRAVALHIPASEFLVERLEACPQPFKEPKIVPTNNFAFCVSETRSVANRLPKSWSNNVGQGPLWELMEDRGWFSEAAFNTEPDEKFRRPRVHDTVRVVPDFTVLSAEEAALYVPKGAIKCAFGPFGQQESVAVKPLDTIDMNKFFPEDISHVFSAGAPVWAIDWCPIFSEDRSAIGHKQYLAVGPLISHDYAPLIGEKEARPACIQIWSISPAAQSNNDTAGGQSKVEDPGCMRCDMILCIDNGPAYDLKWCPLPSNDSIQVDGTPPTPRKLGLLAGTFCDGSLCVYAVPYPADISTTSSTPATSPSPIFVPEPLVRILHPETACWSLDWANSEVLAVGCTNGTIAVYNISDILKTGGALPGTLTEHSQAHLYPDMTPTHFLSAHQSAIRSLSWVRTPTHSAEGEVTADIPTVIISTGYDGVLHVVDLRAPCGNDISRTRDALNTVCFSPYNGGPLTIDQSYVKAISIAPLLLNKGHTLLDTDGPVWHIGASDYHPQIACAVTDGNLVTTNTFRNTRRGGSVPFFEHCIYQMGYNKKTKEYRMLDHLKSRVSHSHPGRLSLLTNYTSGTAKGPPKGTGAWPPEVGIHRAVWNGGNGLASAPWLASATASGLCRVDFLRGKWLHNRVPYDGVDGIRLERDTPDEAEDLE
ncbi:hypothetical protein PHLGIDRAFT_68606 [Phlebiopsis gigantea 11061_1 CR5-6]|uniref:Uncharacterized protein n=1 Tax=Phlebiopsis gigantea (strain 11061_1 CR5-6) TaxID=745531 RepID=A0A0C3SCK2_PHLG1|nr:hypothetical protein PHLGIDRAFT_68606 [Phlebiopsis gigantea 11061_1 CR5-6]